MISAPVFRFAPSPNGPLHLGHAYCALLNARLAARLGGRLLLRIEDIDVERCTPAFEAAMLEDLAWLGLRWEEPLRRQSEHFADYRAALYRLRRDGLVYPAFMSRGEVRAAIAETREGGRDWPLDPDGVPHYPPHDRSLPQAVRAERIAEGRPFAWRLDMHAAVEAVGKRLCWREFVGPDLAATREIAAEPEAWGDVVVARRDVPTSYHLSVVLDDALQGVTHVVRGRDLYAATSVHRLLQALLGLPQPRYHHHRLVLGPDGRKLSKSAGDTGLGELRRVGATPADIAVLTGLDDDLR